MSTLKVLGMLWIACAATAYAHLARFENTPGIEDPTPLEWPMNSAIALEEDRATILMTVNPHCECSRESLAQLLKSLGESESNAALILLFVTPQRQKEAITTLPLWKEASLLPRARLIQDFDGREAKLFGANTSGHVIAYSPDGKLRFSGGMTAARGHAGDSVGSRALTDFLKNGVASRSSAPTFGCHLHEVITPEKRNE